MECPLLFISLLPFNLKENKTLVKIELSRTFVLNYFLILPNILKNLTQQTEIINNVCDRVTFRCTYLIIWSGKS